MLILGTIPKIASHNMSHAQRSIVTNQEVFDFLESAARKYGIEFWRPGPPDCARELCCSRNAHVS